jgi:hypothetical protein
MNEAVQPVVDLLSTHLTSKYPRSLAPDAEVERISLAVLDSDVTGIAQAFIKSGGSLSDDEWRTLRQCAVATKAVLPGLSQDAWIYFARLHAMTQALLRGASDVH